MTTPLDPTRAIEIADSDERAVAALTGYIEYAAGRLGAPFAGDPARPARLLVTAILDAAEARMYEAVADLAAEMIAERGGGVTYL